MEETMEDRMQRFLRELGGVRDQSGTGALIHLLSGQVVSPLWFLNRLYQVGGLFTATWEKQKLFQIQESQIHEKVTEILVKQQSQLERVQQNLEMLLETHGMIIGGSTDGPPTTEKVITDSPSDVVEWDKVKVQWPESLTAGITVQTPPSSPSDPQDTQSGPVEHYSESVVERVVSALMPFVRIVAQDVVKEQSTSVNQESQPLVAPTSAESPFTLVTCPTCQGKGTSKDGKSVCAQCLGSSTIRRY